MLRHTVRAFSLAFLVLSCAAVHADTISMNFVGGSAGSPGFGQVRTLNPGDVAGVFAAPNWNNLANEDGSATGLVDRFGNPTTMGIVWDADSLWSTGNGSGSPNFILMNGYVDDLDNSTSTFSLSNIPYAQYSVVLYVSSDAADGRDASWTIGSTTYFINDDTPPGLDDTFTRITATTQDGAGSSGNYIQFDGLTAGSLSIIGQSLNFRNFLNGIQVIDTTPVPEPSTWLLGLATAGAGAWYVRRRRAGRPT